ncbi:TPA: hypothetical protein I7167_22020 [Vibrio vulnificus]|nr:hypothetical protein [Vibrio vulnificus]
MQKVWEILVNDTPYYPSYTQQIGGVLALSHEHDELGVYNTAYSGYLEHLTDVKSVSERAFGLELLLNGAMRIAHANCDFIPIHFQEVLHIPTGIRSTVSPVAVDDNPFDLPTGIVAPSYSAVYINASLQSQLVNLSQTDEAIRTILFLSGLIKTVDLTDRILAWSTLYKIYETVRHFSNVNSIDFNALFDNSRVTAFTTACNQMSVLGIYARHGHGKAGRAPKNFITELDEAIEIVLNLAKNFCEEYLKLVLR